MGAKAAAGDLGGSPRGRVKFQLALHLSRGINERVLVCCRCVRSRREKGEGAVLE